MSKIIRLEAEHVKRLRVVEINPAGNVIVIGGRNGQGKSSVLDAIQYALGGDPSDAMPVHRGETKAKVVVDLGDIVVQRTFTAAGGTTLTVRDKDGVKQSTPQALLDKLVGRLTFDPLEFARQKPPKQAEILRGILGLDFTEHDKTREKIFNARTVLNRDAKALEARMGGMPVHTDAPAAEKSAAEILQKQQAAAARNQQNNQARLDAKTLLGIAKASQHVADSAVSDVAELERKLAAARQAAADKQAAATADAERAAEAQEKAAALTDEDLAPFTAELKTVEAANEKVRANAARAEVVRQYKEKTSEAEAITAQLEEMDSKKRRAMTEAKYPIDGLSFDAAGGVSLGGIPFEQCSSAEQLKVSVAIGMALNPKLRVLLVRDGSLLDEDSLRVLAEMAQAADAQIWLERVGTDAATSVIIEDGAVAPEPVETP